MVNVSDDIVEISESCNLDDTLEELRHFTEAKEFQVNENSVSEMPICEERFKDIELVCFEASATDDNRLPSVLNDVIDYFYEDISNESCLKSLFRIESFDSKGFGFSFYSNKCEKGENPHDQGADLDEYIAELSPHELIRGGVVCEDEFYREFQSETNLVSEFFLNDVIEARPGAEIPSYMDRVRSLAVSLTGLCTKEQEMFVDRMAGFKKLFMPESRGAGVYEYIQYLSLIANA